MDVGAGYPTFDSVTKVFSDLGWRGVNIEPQPDLHARLAKARPRDINLQNAVASNPGPAELTVFDRAWGWATLNTSVAANHLEAGRGPEVMSVSARPLDDLLHECHVQETTIDFLKIDVEGQEADVLASVDLDRWRPKLIVVEALRPDSMEASHQEWEGYVLQAGYSLALFDGLNRFYVRAGRPDLMRRLATLPNDSDNYVEFGSWRLFSREDQDAWIEQAAAYSDVTLFRTFQEQRGAIAEEAADAWSHQ